MNACAKTCETIPPLVDKILSMPLVSVLLFVSGAGSLAFALTMQFGLGVLPCDLCVWQRYPYGIVGVLALLCLSWKPYRRQTVVLLALCALVYLVGTGFAIVHTGVERHWWASPLDCLAPKLQGETVEDLRKALLQTQDVPCDEIPWSIFGLSMANLNVGASLALAVFAAWAARRESDRQRNF
jgi:disulfide bond formation protein DsbB